MRKYLDGQYVDMTEEEIAEFKAMQAEYEAQEQDLSAEELLTILLKGDE